MITFLFWNLQKNAALGPRLARMITHFRIDVLLVAECTLDLGTVADMLADAGAGPYACPPCDSAKIRVLARLAADDFVQKYTEDGIGLHIRSLKTKKSGRILVAGLHYPSKMQWSNREQELGVIRRLVPAIEAAERRWSRERRTILVGDFNMNPFEDGIMSAFALHAVMTRPLAGRDERDVAGEPYRFFYNPMWGHFGDWHAGPPGSYYLSSSKPGNYFWNLYDQVLLRPALMGRLTDLRILDTDGTESLLGRSGLPDRVGASDHLPLLCALDL